MSTVVNYDRYQHAVMPPLHKVSNTLKKKPNICSGVFWPIQVHLCKEQASDSADSPWAASLEKRRDQADNLYIFQGNDLVSPLLQTAWSTYRGYVGCVMNHGEEYQVVFLPTTAWLHRIFLDVWAQKIQIFLFLFIFLQHLIYSCFQCRLNVRKVKSRHGSLRRHGSLKLSLLLRCLQERHLVSSLPGSCQCRRRASGWWTPCVAPGEDHPSRTVGITNQSCLLKPKEVSKRRVCSSDRCWP